MTTTVHAPWVQSLPRLLFTGGEWSAAADHALLPVVDPATGREFSSVAAAGPGEIEAAVAAAHAALPGWAATLPRQRSDILRKAYELTVERAERIAEIITLENGKALADARAEVAYAAEFFRWYSEEAVRLDGRLTHAPAAENRILVLHQPVGVSLLVTPWNFPAAMATRKIGPALAAGCSVILKPASETPLTALLIAEILHDAGVPAGVVNVLPCRDSAAAVSSMLADPRVRKLSFTGSTEVGRRLLSAAGESVVKCSMELGGNAAFLVLADADVDAAIQGALVAKMRNGGEACTAANRFYVHERVSAEFTAGLAAAMGRLKIGPGLDPGTEVGPLVNDAARAKVAELVADAVDRGARVATGATPVPGEGYFYRPTVLSGVPNDAAVAATEIFGPVAPIFEFTDEDDAIARANSTEFGLVSYLYTRDIGRALRIAEALDSGMVGINRGAVSDPAAPFGGVKQSGVGREGGHEGLLEFTESKYVAVAW